MIYSSWLKMVTLGHFLPFLPPKKPKNQILKNENICWRYHHFTQVYQKLQSYDVRFLRYGVRQTEFFVILGHFLSFYHPTLPNEPENQNFEKKFKKCWKMLSFYTYMTINEHHMIYDSWNIKCDTQNFLSFWAIFCPSSPLTIKKIKISKLEKKPTDIITLHFCTNDNYMMYGSWDMEHNREDFFSFWTVFCPFTPLWTQNIKILLR